MWHVTNHRRIKHESQCATILSPGPLALAEQRTFNRAETYPIFIGKRITTGVVTAFCGTALDPFRHLDEIELAQELAHLDAGHLLPAVMVCKGLSDEPQQLASK